MQKRVKDAPIRHCPSCGAECSVRMVSARPNNLSEFACYCGTCFYVSDVVMGRAKAIEAHNAFCAAVWD